MRLFKMTVELGKQGREVLVHAENEEEAVSHLMKRYTGWKITESVEIIGEAHFTIALLEP
jgi:hypothetical protein